MIKKILIANRGEVALKIVRECRRLGIETVCIYSKSDDSSKVVSEADYSFCIGSDELDDSYLNIHKIIQVASYLNCDAIHPGIGFLSENFKFAEAVRKTNMIFIGPRTECIKIMANKCDAKKIVQKLNIDTIEGINISNKNENEIIDICDTIGYPIIFKANLGGGGKGVRIINNSSEISEKLSLVKQEALKGFGDEDIFLEKYLENAIHIEVQIAGDKYGNIIHILERDCSIQRRYQKIIEETPCNKINSFVKSELFDAALKIAKFVNYDNLGTIEFLLDTNTMRFYFLEMNTRLQVEHAITEISTGINLVELQLKLSEGHRLNIKQSDVYNKFHVMECRLCSEDIFKDFMPSMGTIEKLEVSEIENVIFESDIYRGKRINPFYDPMIAKIISYNENRTTCISQLLKFIEKLKLEGLNSNKEMLQLILENKKFLDGEYCTNFLDKNYLNILKEIKKRRCPNCNKILNLHTLRQKLWCCDCGYHFPINAMDRISLICDKDSFYEYPQVNFNKDYLNNLGEDYLEKLENTKIQTKMNEAVITGEATIEGIKVSIAVMDSNFMMGSMGYVVGEQISQCIEIAIEKETPLLIFAASGGARMQEGIISLMQMSKVCAQLKCFFDKNILFISCLTNPTTGGVCASFALLGDINISEPGAIVGFAGRRVIENTINEERLPADFQNAEEVQKRGFIDIIVERKSMKSLLYNLLKLNGY